jgi:hypothetical protein
VAAPILGGLHHEYRLSSDGQHEAVRMSVANICGPRGQDTSRRSRTSLRRICAIVIAEIHDGARKGPERVTTSLTTRAALLD